MSGTAAACAAGESERFVVVMKGHLLGRASDTAHTSRECVEVWMVKVS